MFHLLEHMSEQLQRWGPVRNVWMFGPESYFGYLMGLIKTKKHPVASILRADRNLTVSAMAKDLMQANRPGGTEPHYADNNYNKINKTVKRHIRDGAKMDGPHVHVWVTHSPI